MSDQRNFPPVLAEMDEQLWSITSSLVERNAELQKRNQEAKQAIAELTASIGQMEKAALADRLQMDEKVNAKLEDFRGMIQRRDDKIAKLTAKLEKQSKR